MMRINTFFSLILICLFSSCELFTLPGDDVVPEPDSTGLVTFNFAVPVLHGDYHDRRYPVRIDGEIHRYHLNIYSNPADTATDNYIKCAGLVRTKQFYDFTLEPGQYFYEAAIICTGQQWQCEFIGFPEDKVLWSYGIFETLRDSAVNVNIKFKVPY